MTLVHSSFWYDLHDNKPKMLSLPLNEAKSIFCGENTIRDKKNVAFERFSLNTFVQDTKGRKNGDVKSISGVVFDVDHDDNPRNRVHIEAFLKEKNILFYSYTTKRHTPTSPRWRLVIPCEKQIINPDLYTHLGKYLISTIQRGSDVLFAEMVDSAWKQRNKIYALPTTSKDSHHHHDGIMMDPYALAPIPGFKMSHFDREAHNKIKKDVRTYDRIERDDVEEALGYIDPNCDYEFWIRMGMAIKSGLGDSGFSIWDHWSLKGANYPKASEQSTRNHWNSFTSDGVTIGTLFFEAKERGYKSERRLVQNESMVMEASVQLNYEEDDEDSDYYEINSYTTEINRFVDHWSLTNSFNPPYFVGSVFKEYEAMLPYHQPEYALGIAMMTASMIFNRKTKRRGIQPNIYSVLVGGPSTGKTFSSELMRRFLHTIDIGGHIVTNISSIEGFAKALIKRSGMCVLSIDEGAQILQGKNSSNVQGWELKAFYSLLSLFSASQVFETADTKEKDSIKIEKPFVSILKLFTNQYYNTITKEDFESGYIRRTFIFEQCPFSDRRHHGNLSFSSHSLKEASDILKMHVDEPKITEEAFVLFRKFVDATDKLTQSFQDHQFASTVAGTTALLEKVILLAPEVDMKNNTFTITEETMKWSISVVVKNLQKQYKIMSDHCHENKQSEMFHRVWRQIKKMTLKTGQVRGSDLLTFCRGLRKTDRDNILKSIEEEGLVNILPGKTRGFVIQLTRKGEKSAA